jgi:serine-type D-Ala-D-Ala carboxypeptidase/endopeptidase (penicillin-binding protein 4)
MIGSLKTAIFWVAFGFAMIVGESGSASNYPWAEGLKKKLAPLGSKASLTIQTLSGEKILDINAGSPKSPASIAKVVSTACSLETLKPSYQFATEFLTRGKIKDGSLTESLIVKGSGDPSFVIEDLREQVSRLRSLYQIQTLNGALEIDTSFLENPRMSMSESFEGDEGRAFTAELTALPFNFNSFGVWIATSPNDKKALVEISPSQALPLILDFSGVRIQSSGGSPGNSNVDYDPKKGRIIVSGNFSPEILPKAVYRSVPDPYEYFFETFQALWKQSGGEWKNPSVKLIRDSSGSVLLSRHESRALSTIVRDVNKSSLNLSAEMILLAASAQEFGWPAGRQKTIKLLNKCLSDHKVSTDDLKLENASGLSKNSRIETGAFTSFIQSYLRTASAPDFIASLPVIGQDGTMKAKFKNLAGRARVKTGTMKDVGSIAGLAFPVVGPPLIFTFVINGLPGFSPEAQNYEKIVLESMLSQ